MSPLKHNLISDEELDEIGLVLQHHGQRHDMSEGVCDKSVRLAAVFNKHAHHP